MENERLEQLWRADTGEEIRVKEDFKPEILGPISPLENFAVLYRTGKFRIIKLPLFEHIVDIHDERVCLHGFSPNEKWLAISTMGREKTVMLIPTEPGARTPIFSIPFNPRHVKFSPDSRLIAMDGYDPRATKIYEIESGALAGQFEGDFRGFSEDSKRVSTASIDPSDGNFRKAKLWTIGSSTQLLEFPASFDCRFSLLGDRILIESPFSVLDATTGAEIFRKPGYAEFSKDGRFASYWSEDDIDHQLCASTGAVLHCFEKPPTDQPNFGLSFAGEHSECATFYYDFDENPTIVRTKPVSAPNHSNEVQIWHRRRPEFWYGYAWLWEFWLVVALFGALVWSIVRPISTIETKTQALDAARGALKIAPVPENDN